MQRNILNNENLGQKHRNYNKKLQEIITKNQTLTDINYDNCDIENMLMIDLASHNRNVDFILQVLTSADMLYVSRALSKSTWLVTEDQYSNIIHPEYLTTNLLPQMTTTAYNKLIKHIRHNIKDTKRAECFYLNEEKPIEALKWLPYCSVPFIENKITKHLTRSIKKRTFKRLCEKSVTIFEIVFNNIPAYDKRTHAEAVTFFLNTDIDKYLYILESKQISYTPKFNAKATKKIMAHSPKRVIEQFEKYIKSIHIPTFVKYLKGEEIKPFLTAQARKHYLCNGDELWLLRVLFKFDNLKYFLQRMPKNEQIELVKEMLTSKEDVHDSNNYLQTILADVKSFGSAFAWYQFICFEEAFNTIQNVLTIDISKKDKYSMLMTLVICANNNFQYLQTLVQYYLKNNINEELKYKVQFATDLVNHTMVYKYDENTWKDVNELFKTIKIYDDSNDNENESLSLCVKSIILYLVLQNKEIPPAIEKRFNFTTMKTLQIKLSDDQREKLFNFLHGYLSRRIPNHITDKKNLSETVEMLCKFADLIKDWKKSLIEYPMTIQKLRDVIKLNKEKAWKVDLTILYNKKSYQRYLFEESVMLNPCEKVLLNVLKHDPQLLERHNDEVVAMQTKATVNLRRLLNKLRVYWPNSLCPQWINAYRTTFNEPTEQIKIKNAVHGLCILLSQKSLLEIIQEYKPEQTKIDWSKIDGHVFTIQQMLGKYMYLARPQLYPNCIVTYAKGDYIQYALPSLLAIFYDMKQIDCEKYIPLLLDAPVSVQKHGIRFAFKRLHRDTVKQILLDKWTLSKNVSIRAIVFTFTYNMLCNEKDETKALELWELLGLFIDNLTLKEDKKIYEILSKVVTVPSNVRAGFLIKCYDFLQCLIKNAKESDRSHYEWQRDVLVQYIREVIETINQNFVQNVIQEYSETDFRVIVPIISAYLLSAGDEKSQEEKYEKVLVPLIKSSLSKWNEKRNDKFYVRSQLRQTLSNLSVDLKDYVIPNNKPIPVKMFASIQEILEKSLTVADNYVMLTQWKLVLGATKFVSECDTKDWNEICSKIAFKFGKMAVESLQYDESCFPCVYPIFSRILNRVINDFKMPDEAILIIYNCFLSNPDFIQSYLSIIEMNTQYGPKKDAMYNEMWQQISSHPSKEVQMHFNNRIGREVLTKN